MTVIKYKGGLLRALINRANNFFSWCVRGRVNLGTRTNKKALDVVKLKLLQGKTWRYLRYLHARRALALASGWNSIIIIGCGNGLAEIALAIEFPNKTFHLTDYEGATHSLKYAKNLTQKFNLNNVTFGSLNILNPVDKKYDIVYSVEVLEHIKDDKLAASNMCRMANNYVFCLVPFAEKEVNENKERRKYVLEKFEHYVAGYDEEALKDLFPSPIAIHGCYWRDSGVIFRSKLSEMDAQTIKAEYDGLLSDAQQDIKNHVQKSDSEALGIWVLADVRSYPVSES